MPREQRKRGKKHKKSAQDAHDDVPEPAQDYVPFDNAEEEQPQPGPSWIKPKQQPDVDPEAPFGYVESDVKAYFRTVDLQIRDWQEAAKERVEETADADTDPNEERRMFFVAALREMSGKEKQLATDPDCSVVLERMAYSMDDFARRVFLDSLSGSYEQLAKHRFASHVVQTLFTVAADTVSRETRGILPPLPSSDAGELRTLTQLNLDICAELLPTFTALLMDPFASHVLRALLVLLAPTSTVNSLRSKRSAAWKARQGPLASLFDQDQAAGHATPQVPQAFRDAAAQFVEAVREGLAPNEVRALAADKVASPVLQILLEVEASLGQADQPGSLMDRVLVGMITELDADPNATPEQSDYLSTLLRDPTSSHLLEALVAHSPQRAFAVLWAQYFSGKLLGGAKHARSAAGGLALHPVANFVVARALARVDAAALKAACGEIEGQGLRRILKANRAGVVKALIERAAELGESEDAVVELMKAAFGLDEDEDAAKLFVPCVLRLLSREEYTAALAEMENAGEDGAQRRQDTDKKGKKHHGEDQGGANALEPKTQGAVLLQSMLRLSSPHNGVVVDSIASMSTAELLAMAHHPTSSRVLDVLVDAREVPLKAKRTLLLALIGHWHELADDRIGSRVAERMWAWADPYLKEKIGRSLIPHEQDLAASFYGRFFARKLNLYLLRRDPEKWKDTQCHAPPPAETRKTVHAGGVGEGKQEAAGDESGRPKKKRKQAEGPVDEIDALFDAVLGGKKFKKGKLETGADAADKEPCLVEAKVKKRGKGDRGDEAGAGLGDVLTAIRAAPQGDSRDRRGREKPKR